VNISHNYRFLLGLSQLFNPFEFPINPKSVPNGNTPRPIKVKVAMKRRNDPLSSTKRKQKEILASDLNEGYCANCCIQRYPEVNFNS
jgi:hypothetical protein